MSGFWSDSRYRRGPADYLEWVPAQVVRRSLPMRIVSFIGRWLFEFVCLFVFLYAADRVADRLGVGFWWGVLLLLAGLGGLFAWKVTRRWLLGLLGVELTRHRLRSFFIACRIHNRAGKIPMVLAVTPTPVGERARLWLPPGLALSDFVSAAEHLATACWAREVRVSRSRRFAQLVEVHVVRRDPLASVLIPSVFTSTARVKAGRTWRWLLARAGKRADVVTVDVQVLDDGTTTSTTAPAAAAGPAEGPVPSGGSAVPPQPRTGRARSSSGSGSGSGPVRPDAVFVGGEDVSDYI